jgi:CspA family cold shock protein
MGGGSHIHYLPGAAEETKQVIEGRVKWFDTTKGYGFVVTEDENGDVLLHANVLRNYGRSSIAEGAVVSMEVQATDRGRQAVEIFDIDAPDIVEPEEDTFGQPRPTDIALEVEPDTPLVPARVKWFDKSKGFGFVNIFGHPEDVFVHMEVLRIYGLSDLQPGEAVGVKIVEGPRGKMAAEVRSWDHGSKDEAL